MATWAYGAANMSTLQMNGTLIEPYMKHMCVKGYTGPLCGACEPDHGHTGTTCIKCLPQQTNSFLYFLVCCFMMVVPVVQMLLHAKGVNKNTELVAAASKLSWSSYPSGMQPVLSGSNAGGGSYTPVLPTLKERQQSEEEANAAAMGADVVPKDVAAVEMAHMHRTYVCPSAAVAAGAAPPPAPAAATQAGLPPPPPAAAAAAMDDGWGRSDLDTWRVDQGSAGEMLSPFSEPSAVAGAIAVSRNGSNSSMTPTIQDIHASQVGEVVQFVWGGGGERYCYRWRCPGQNWVKVVYGAYHAEQSRVFDRQQGDPPSGAAHAVAKAAAAVAVDHQLRQSSGPWLLGGYRVARLCQHVVFTTPSPSPPPAAAAAADDDAAPGPPSIWWPQECGHVPARVVYHPFSCSCCCC
jgi:hypothetical protein